MSEEVVPFLYHQWRRGESERTSTTLSHRGSGPTDCEDPQGFRVGDGGTRLQGVQDEVLGTGGPMDRVSPGCVVQTGDPS